MINSEKIFFRRYKNVRKQQHFFRQICQWFYMQQTFIERRKNKQEKKKETKCRTFSQNYIVETTVRKPLWKKLHSLFCREKKMYI